MTEKKDDWEVIEECNDEEGNPTSWGKLLRHREGKYPDFIFISTYGDRFNVEIYNAYDENVVIKSCATFNRARKWADEYIRKYGDGYGEEEDEEMNYDEKLTNHSNETKYGMVYDKAFSQLENKIPMIQKLYDLTKRIDETRIHPDKVAYGICQWDSHTNSLLLRESLYRRTVCVGCEDGKITFSGEYMTIDDKVRLLTKITNEFSKFEDYELNKLQEILEQRNEIEKKMNIDENSDAVYLAHRLNRFYSDFDPYDYADQEENGTAMELVEDGVNFHNALESLEDMDFDHIADFLREVIEDQSENDNDSLLKEAQSILEDLEKYENGIAIEREVTATQKIA